MKNRMSIQTIYNKKIKKLYGSKKAAMNYYSVDRVFPGPFDVFIKAFMQCIKSTLTPLMKNDLNGHFLTDQPGQPFKTKDPGDYADTEVWYIEASCCFMMDRNPGHT